MSEIECRHTFGCAGPSYDSRLVIGEGHFIREALPTTHPDLYWRLPPDDYFKFCPDCGALLEPIIEEIKNRLASEKSSDAASIKLFPHCHAKPK